MKTRNIILIVLVTWIFGACTGGKKDETTTPVADGPGPRTGPPPGSIDPKTGEVVPAGGPAAGPVTTEDRTLSRNLATRFQEVLKSFFEASDKGWPKAECEKVGKAFLALNKEAGGERIASFAYNAGVAYSRCNMTKQAREAYQLALSIDPHFPSAKSGLLLLDLKNPEDYLKHEADLMRDSYAMQDPDIQYNLALAYFIQYSRAGNAKVRAQLLDALRKALASSGRIPNETLEGTRIRLKIYGLAILFYLEADRRKDANANLARIFIGQARDYFKPCTGEQGVKDVYAREALAMYYNAYGLYVLSQGTLGPAFDEFKKAQECEPENLAANLNIGMLGVSVREPEMAIKALELVTTRYPKIPEIREAELALAVSYKVFAMTLQDMSENQFANKERIQMEIDRFREAIKLGEAQLQVYEQIIKGDNVRALIPKLAEITGGDARAMQAQLDKGDVTVKMIQDDVARVQPRIATAVRDVLPARIKEKEEELARLEDANKLRAEARGFFEKSRTQYEKTLAAIPNDYRVAFNLAMLYYKAGDLLGDLTGNYKKAQDLFDRVFKNKQTPKQYKDFAEKHSSDIRSALVRLKEIEDEKKKAPEAPK